MSHLIYSRKADNSVMSTSEIVSRAPAVFADTKAEKLTDRYAQLKTSDFIPVMADYGYFPTQAAQRKTRKNMSAEHTSHLLAFAKAGDTDGSGGVRSEVLLYNSHDGSSSVRLLAGAFRFVCTNGIVAGEGFNTRLHHTKASMNNFEQLLRSTVENLPRVLELFEKMRSINLDYEQQRELARKAVSLRWDYIDNIYVAEPKAGIYADRITVTDALEVKRYSDRSNDFFTVWNRIQENVLRGNVFVKKVIGNEQGWYDEVKQRKSRPINSVKEHLRVNQALFDLIEV